MGTGWTLEHKRCELCSHNPSRRPTCICTGTPPDAHTVVESATKIAADAVAEPPEPTALRERTDPDGIRFEVYQAAVVAYDGEEEVGELYFMARGYLLLDELNVQKTHRGKQIATRMADIAREEHPNLNVGIYFGTDEGQMWWEEYSKHAVDYRTGNYGLRNHCDPNDYDEDTDGEY